MFYVGRRNASVDAFDFRQRALVQTIRMPIGSGVVSSILALKERSLLV